MDASNISREAPVSTAFRSYVPHRPLSEFVALFWYWRGHTLPRSTERLLPAGTMELVIRLDAGQPSGGGISGPHSQAFFIERSAEDELLGVHFKPAGALHHPAVALALDAFERDANLPACARPNI